MPILDRAAASPVEATSAVRMAPLLGPSTPVSMVIGVDLSTPFGSSRLDVLPVWTSKNTHATTRHRAERSSKFGKANHFRLDVAQKSPRPCIWRSQLVPSASIAAVIGADRKANAVYTLISDDRASRRQRFRKMKDVTALYKEYRYAADFFNSRVAQRFDSEHTRAMYRIDLFSFEEFAEWWQRISRDDALQSRWLMRFEDPSGYLIRYSRRITEMFDQIRPQKSAA